MRCRHPSHDFFFFVLRCMRVFLSGTSIASQVSHNSDATSSFLESRFNFSFSSYVYVYRFFLVFLLGQGIYLF